MAATPLLAAVAFIGKDDAPLYIRSFAGGGTGDEFFKLQMMMFSALDVLHEKMGAYTRLPEGLWPAAPAPTPDSQLSQQGATSPITATPVVTIGSTPMAVPAAPSTQPSFVGVPPLPSSSDPFTGLLLTCERYKLFGYISNSTIKIIVVLKDVLLREDRVRELFKQLYRLYTQAACNPFAKPGEQIISPTFEKRLVETVDAALPTLEYTGPLPF